MEICTAKLATLAASTVQQASEKKDLGATILEEMQCEKVSIFGLFELNESVVVSFIITVFLGLLFFCLTRGFKTTNISKRQAFIEWAVNWLTGMVEGMIGEEGKRYVSYLTTVLLYIGLSNIIGLFGFKPPTKDINVTVALAAMSIILIEFAGIRAKGVKKWAKGFAEPVWVIAPLNVMEIVIRPLSLCMRLFGNVLGAFVIMKLIEFIVPVVVPLLFSFYFDMFDGLLQAYVFVFLTSLFIKEAVEE